MNENLKQKIIQSESSIIEITALLQNDFNSGSVTAFFQEKGITLSAEEADEFITLMQGAKKSADSTKLNDDVLAEVSGGVEQALGDAGDIIDTTRYLACKAAPFIAGCDRIIKRYESRGF